MIKTEPSAKDQEEDDYSQYAQDNGDTTISNNLSTNQTAHKYIKPYFASN